MFNCACIFSTNTNELCSLASGLMSIVEMLLPKCLYDVARGLITIVQAKLTGEVQMFLYSGHLAGTDVLCTQSQILSATRYMGYNFILLTASSELA